jgi:hypothetical protein
MKSKKAVEVSALASTPNPLSPVTPLLQATQWLRDYFVREPAFAAGDDTATCYSSFAAVILSAVVAGTDSPVILAGITSFPAPYIAAVSNSMRRDQLWSLPDVVHLKGVFLSTPYDWTALSMALSNAMESAWAVVWSSDACIALESLRRGILFGGEVQRWLDEDAADFFDLV